MKKLYALAAMMSCTAVFAQQKPTVMAPFAKADKTTSIRLDNRNIQALPGIESAQFRVPLISEDFEALTAPAIPAGWVATTEDLGGYAGYYTGDEVDANVGGFWPVPNNGSTQFIMTNDDALGSPDGGDLSDEQLHLPSLDFQATGNTNHGLTFDCFHDMNYGSGNAEIRVSNDGGTTWTTELTVTPDLANWQTYVVDLSAYDNDTDVRIMFFWNDGGLTGGSPNWGTGLALDNITVDAIPNNNMTINSVIGADLVLDYDYSMIPVSQLREVTMTVDYINNGVAAQPGVDYTWDITNGGGSVATGAGGAPFTAAPFVRDTLYGASGYTPGSTLDTYTITADIFSDSVDAVPGDNMGTASFDVTQYTWGRDNGTFDGSLTNVSSQPNQPISFGLQYITNSTAGDMVYGVDVGVANVATNVGQLFYTALFEFDGNSDFVFVDQSSDIEIQNGDLGQVVTVPFGSGIALTADQLYLVVAGHYGGTDDVAFATAGVTQEGSVLGYDQANSIFQLLAPPTPVVRLNHDPTLAVVDRDLGFELFQNRPNPFTTSTTIQFQLDVNAQVSVEVYDITGKQVMTIDGGSRSAGMHTIDLDGSSLAAGSYNYSLVVNGNRATKHFVVAK